MTCELNVCASTVRHWTIEFIQFNFSIARRWKKDGCQRLYELGLDQLCRIHILSPLISHSPKKMLVSPWMLDGSVFYSILSPWYFTMCSTASLHLLNGNLNVRVIALSERKNMPSLYINYHHVTSSQLGLATSTNNMPQVPLSSSTVLFIHRSLHSFLITSNSNPPYLGGL